MSPIGISLLGVDLRLIFSWVLYFHLHIRIVDSFTIRGHGPKFELAGTVAPFKYLKVMNTELIASPTVVSR